MPSSFARGTRSLTRQAPSSSEYSLCTWRWTNAEVIEWPDSSTGGRPSGVVRRPVRDITEGYPSTDGVSGDDIDDAKHDAVSDATEGAWEDAPSA